MPQCCTAWIKTRLKDTRLCTLLRACGSGYRIRSSSHWVRYISTVVLSAASLLLTSVESIAQSNANDDARTNGNDSAERLPTLVIEADTRESGGEPIGSVEHADFAGRYTRVNTADLNRDDVDLGEVLAFESGVQQRQIGGYGSFSSVTIRGSAASQTTVFLDGIRLNSAANAIVDLSTFDVRSFSSVDVYRGAAPLQLGATNLGGAVNLNSLNTNRNTTQLKLTAGSFGTFQTNLAHRSNYAKWNTVATVEAGKSDNDFTLDNDNTTPLNPNDDRREPRNNANIERVSVLGKLAYQHTPDSVSDVLLQHTQRSTGVPEFRNAEANEASFSEGRGQLHLSHRINQPTGWSQRHTAFVQWVDDHFDDSLSQVGLGAQDFRSEQRVVGVGTYRDLFTDTGKWAISAEARRDGFDSEDPLGRNTNVTAARNSVNAGVGYTHFSADERILITPRLRTEYHSSEWDGTSLSSNSNETTATLNPEISVRFDQNETLSWSASVGRYFRIPTFTEMFGTQGLLVGNSELEPERGVNAEIGLAWTPRDNLASTVSLFHSDRSDTIVATFDARGIGQFTNTGDASITGLELEALWQATTRLKFKANVTFQDTTNHSDIAAFDNKQLPNQSATTAYAQGSYDFATHWQLWADVSLARDRFFDLGNFLPAENSTISNLGAQWQKNNLGATLSLSNITNQFVEDFNGFPKPGRAVHLSLSYRFLQ